MATAYGPYDLFRALIRRVSWPTEQERRVALESVDELEKAAVFGSMAAMMTCEHPEDERSRMGKCALCGRQVSNPPEIPRGWH